ncbi:MAG TPA: hypothetical protein VK563_07765, partial [Puia sp.]|nr:hypothetical protein [Puia sp.]
MRRINGIVLFLLMMSCQNPSTSGNRSGSADTDSSSSGHNASGQASAGDSSRKVRLVTLDPGHFHAALVQKSMYADVDTVVHVYAPDGPDVKFHLDRVAGYNTRAQSPTHWKEIVYTG